MSAMGCLVEIAAAVCKIASGDNRVEVRFLQHWERTLFFSNNVFMYPGRYVP